MKPRTVLLWSLLLLPLSSAAAATPVSDGPLYLTLDQAIVVARDRSVDLTLARLTLEDFRSRYRQAVGGALPDIAVDGTYSRNLRNPVAFFPDGKISIGRKNSFDATVSAEQPLYSGGKVATGIQAAKHGLSAGTSQVASTENDVVLAVKELFYAALLSSATVGIERDNLASAEDHLATIRARYRQGLDSDLTVRRQEVEVANARATLIRAKNVHEMALISLQDLLLLDIQRPLIVIGTLETPKNQVPDDQGLIREAVAKHPGLKASRDMSEFYRHLEDIAAADLKPQLGLFGRISWLGESDNFRLPESQRATTAAAGLRLHYSLFSGGDYLEAFRQARIQAQRSKEEADRLERSIRVEVKRRWLDIAEALERSRSQEEAVGQARLALQATEIRYKAGQANQLELNDATFALNRVRTQSIQAAHDYWTSLAGLERAVGMPLREVTP